MSPYGPGKLRIHMVAEDFQMASLTKGREHRSTVGTKQRKRFKEGDVVEADKLIDRGHERFSSGDFEGFSKAAAAIENQFSRLAEAPSSDGEDQEIQMATGPDSRAASGGRGNHGKSFGGCQGALARCW